MLIEIRMKSSIIHDILFDLKCWWHIYKWFIKSLFQYDYNQLSLCNILIIYIF